MQFVGQRAQREPARKRGKRIARRRVRFDHDVVELLAAPRVIAPGPPCGEERIARAEPGFEHDEAKVVAPALTQVAPALMRIALALMRIALWQLELQSDGERARSANHAVKRSRASVRPR